MCNSFMVLASMVSAPAPERIVGVAEVPLRPFWVLTYQHSARRAAGQFSGLYLPCPSEFRQRLVQCGLQDCILESKQMQWWDASPALRSGVWLYSFVLAGLGQVEAGCLDFEESLLSVYYQVNIATVKNVESWTIISDDPVFVTVVRQSAARPPQPFSWKLVLEFLGAGHAEVPSA